MRQFTCSICGYVYDEAKGIPEAGIAAGTKWEDLPEEWVCPICKANKKAFKENAAVAATTAPEATHFEKELSPMEMSIICSNLARGCEKQYMPEQQEAFAKLAAFFKQKAEPAENVDREQLLELIQKDLEKGYPYANYVSGKKPDRGALRSLVWSEKVTRMLDSLLAQYAKEGDKMLENTGVYICTICGFVSVGDNAPELCPVCKVPSWKFEKVEGRTK